MLYSFVFVRAKMGKGKEREEREVPEGFHSYVEEG